MTHISKPVNNAQKLKKKKNFWKISGCWEAQDIVRVNDKKIRTKRLSSEAKKFL